MSNKHCDGIISTILSLLSREDSESSSESGNSDDEFLICVASTLNRLSENLTLDYTTEQFVVLYRIHPKLFVKLSSKYENSPYYRSQPVQGGGRPPIPPEKQVLIFLWYAGQRQASCRTISEHFDVSIDRSCTVLHRISAFLGSLSEEAITWQTPEQQKDACKIYCQRSGIPNIIGSIDSFHVGIPTPKVNPGMYVNSSRSHSVQVQVICDHRLKFLDVFVGFPGSANPAEVMENSFIFPKLPQLCKGKCLVGNPSYKITPWCLVPYKEGSLNSAQENFNACLENVLLDARESFSLLRERFPCLYHLRLRHLTTACELIMGCCILHNLADASDLVMLKENNEVNQAFGFDSDILELKMQEVTPSGADIRDSLAQQLFEENTPSEGEGNL